jgi:hypothetical protein
MENGSMADEEQDLAASEHVVSRRGDPAMQLFELATAATAIVAVVLLALAR